MATWKQPHDNPMSAIEELIERVDKAEADRDRLVEALRKIAEICPNEIEGITARKALEGL